MSLGKSLVSESVSSVKWEGWVTRPEGPIPAAKGYSVRQRLSFHLISVFHRQFPVKAKRTGIPKCLLGIRLCANRSTWRSFFNVHNRPWQLCVPPYCRKDKSQAFQLAEVTRVASSTFKMPEFKGSPSFHCPHLLSGHTRMVTGKWNHACPHSIPRGQIPSAMEPRQLTSPGQWPDMWVLASVNLAFTSCLHKSWLSPNSAPLSLRFLIDHSTYPQGCQRD